MKIFFQILFLLLTWFSSSAVIAFPKLALPTTENQQLESEVKIGVEHFANTKSSSNSYNKKSR
jgi:hypothetical protein